MDLDPDLVIGYSDIQADIARELIRRGVTVWINNHRTVEGILKFMAQLGAMVGRSNDVEQIINGLEVRLNEIQSAADMFQKKPRVYFEEWYDPLISGSHWVGELIGMAGGEYIFPEQMTQALGKDRIIANPHDVVEKNPDIILASWCGKKFKKEKLVTRPGWDQIAAVRHDDIHEIDSAIILQPGPAALTDGIEKIQSILSGWVKKQ